MGQKTWNGAECEYLKEYYGLYSCKKIARTLKCGTNAVRHQAKKLGLCKKRAHSGDTLCWECRRATGGCSWSRDFVPVVGWEADKTVIRNDEQESYFVMKCPLFLKEVH